MISIAVEDLAAWLESQTDVLWSVDGDENLEGTLALPCAGGDLAAALRIHGGMLRVVPPNGAPPTLTRENLEKAAAVADGALVFRLAWTTGDDVGEPWLLIQETLADAASA